MATSRPWTLAVDFGTSFTVAAVLGDGQGPRVLEIDGELRVPSVILIDEGDIVVGRVAEEIAGARPSDALRAPKSRLGDQAPVILSGKPFQVTVLVGALFQRVYQEAIRQMGAAPTEVRLTHPATWSRTRQARLLEAAARGGLPEATLVSEPVAAALSYWHAGDLEDDNFVAVYDLGGGTFDSAVLQSIDGGFRVIGRPDGDATVGGELFDEVVVNLIGDQVDPATWERVQIATDGPWQQTAAIIRKEARRAKETLSNYPYAEVVVSLPSGLTSVRVTRDSFEQAIASYIADSVGLLRRCLAEASVRDIDLAAIQLAGGSSRIPAVEAAIRAEFPTVEVHRRGDPKHSVALGALVAPQMSITPLPSGYGSSDDGLRPRDPIPPVLLVPAPSPRSTASAPPSTPPPAGPPSVSFPTPAGPVSTPPAVPPPPAARAEHTVAASSAPPPPPPRGLGPTAPPPPPERKRRVAVIGAAACVLIAIVAAVIFASSRDDAEDETASSSTASAAASPAGSTSAPQQSTGNTDTTSAPSTEPSSESSAPVETPAAQVDPAAFTAPMTLVVDLNPAAVWEDGSPITVADLDCTWRANLNTPGAINTVGYDQISSVEQGTSDKQAIISFSSPYAAYRTLFDGIIKAGAVSNCDDISGDFETELPFSGREWQLQSWNPEQSVLVPNEYYWGDRTPGYSRLVQVPRADSDTEINSVKAGEVDFIYPQWYSGIGDALADPNVAASLTYGGDFEALYFQVGSTSPFADVSYRWAFNQAIDADAFFNTIYGPIAPGRPRLTCGPVVPGPYCNEGTFPNKYDPGGSAATMEAAGYVRNADGLWAKDGAVPHVRWMINAGNSRRETAQEYLIPLLRTAGFDVVTDNCDAACVFQQRLPAGDFDMAMFINTFPPDPSNLVSSFSCDNIPSAANDFQGQNYQFWCNDAASTALYQSDTTTDSAARADLIKSAIAAMNVDNIMIPLFQFPKSAAYRTDKVANVEGQLNNYRAFSDTYQWQDLDGDGQVVIGAEQWPGCLNPVTECANSSWYVWTVRNPVLPALWDTTNDGGYAFTDLVATEPVVYTPTG